MIVGNIGGGYAKPYTGDIQYSLRVRSSASANLSRLFSTPTANTVWTLSIWIKRGSIGSEQSIFAAGDSEIFFNASNQLVFKKDGAVVATSTTVFRDTLSHGHLHITSENNQMTAYWNGSLVLTYAGTIPDFNSAVTHYIGRDSAASDDFADFYISRVSFFDNAGSTPYFTATLNAEINEWVTLTQAYIKSLVDSKGTNSFMLDFDNGTSLTTLGYDKSSKGNNWTLSNFSLTAGATYDWMLDTPSHVNGGSYPTFNALTDTATLSNGNLTVTSSAGYTGRRSTLQIPTTGQWYWEVPVTTQVASAGSWVDCGMIVAANALTTFAVGSGAIVYGDRNDQYGIYNEAAAVTTSSAVSFSSGDVLRCAYDADSGKFWFGRGTTWFDSSAGSTGNPSTGANATLIAAAKEWYPFVQTSVAGSTVSINFGQQPFAYPPPTGFQSLCQANFADSESIVTSGSFTGNLNANGPYIEIKGTPTAMTINGNAVTFGTHADKLAFGFKLRTNSSSYNNTGSNTFSVSSTGPKRKYALAKGNP